MAAQSGGTVIERLAQVDRLIIACRAGLEERRAERKAARPAFLPGPEEPPPGLTPVERSEFYAEQDRL